MLHLKSLYQITSDNSLSYLQKMEKLLILGSDVFNLELAIISQIHNDTYTVKHAISPDNALQAETTFPLSNTYCIHTLLADKSTSFHHAGKSEIAEHPCYLDFGLESYIGAPLMVEGKRYGTLNFSSSEPRANPFGPTEHEFIEFLAHWVGNEIARNNALAILQKQKKRLTHQQNLMNEISKLSGVGAWEIDLVTQSIHWSEATRLIHEVDKDYVPDLETAIDFYKAGKNRERLRAMVNKVMLKGGDFAGEFEIVTHTGKIKWVASQGRAEIENDQCVRLYGAFQDITKQVYYREQLEKRHQELTLALEARSTFLANMSHEIRTPINGVIGSLQVMDKTGLNNNQKNFLNLAQSSADSLLAQVNDVLDFAKIDSKQIELENTPFIINDLLNECVAPFTVFAKNKSIKLTSDFALTENIAIIADPTRIRQVYANLISNAIKFTLQGEVVISSELITLEKQKSHLILTIKDSGIGITEQQLKHLFLPFRQADASTTRKFGGTGLGLSISQSLATLMNGEITVQSTEQKGSTFTVKIEVSNTDSFKPISIAKTPSSNAKEISQLRILIVEDNEINQLVISEMLKLKDVPHDIASDGLEALEKLDKEAKQNRFYSLILMDCQMPNMDGYQATQSIRKLNLEISDIPIIALTANAMKGDREKCIDSGMTDYLAKPIQQQRLYSKLEEYV
ncbi:ATP-binding protein [Paraglaciecola sp. L3A3]|uniref:GAF domain-containing hybrid sensor histidine kinase/response regulator n=1 Tax=Paraglaciecola sp. L3A3 TaxID=2686358 RepID=UPI001E4C496E|nr:ATP-binding protein [Paraglaciecola sp. L3A3]